jgi:hypothetical protein
MNTIFCLLIRKWVPESHTIIWGVFKKAPLGSPPSPGVRRAVSRDKAARIRKE